MARELHISSNVASLQAVSSNAHPVNCVEPSILEEKTMNLLTRIYSRIVEAKRSQRGQTMTEYVLIIAAIAVAGYIAYQGLEVGINGLIAKVTASLNAA